MPKIVRKNQKKRALALAAIDLFAEQGFAKTSVESIAKSADVGKGTVYLYFDSKEEIIIEIWDYVCEVLDEHREEKYKKAKNVTDKLATFFDFSSFEEDGLIEKLVKIFSMNLSIILNAYNKSLQENYIRKMQKDIDEITALYKEGVLKGEFRDLEPQLIAGIYENMFSGSIIASMCKLEDFFTMKDSFHQKRDLLLNLIKK
jgi:AcrR family transcriptional regulator